MPSGKTHEAINYSFLLLTLFAFTAIMSYVQFDWLSLPILTGAVVGYIIGTYCFGPDLDLPSRPYRRWRQFRFIWHPYQKWFPHRSVWTHGHVIGDLIRVVYVGVWFLPAYLIVSFLLPMAFLDVQKWVASFIIDHATICVALLVGIVLASSLHIFADHLVSWVKRRRFKKKK